MSDLGVKTDHAKGSRGLYWIGAYDVAKGAALLIVAIGILRLVHRDVEEIALHWIHILHADPDGRLLHSLVARSGLITDQQLELMSLGSFLYAILHFVEGYGLIKQRRWAEYLTVLITGAFLPVEIFELLRHFSFAKVGITAVNALCVWYVGRQLLRQLRPKPVAAALHDLDA